MNVVMIICHKNAEQVIRFAKKCRTNSTDVIIHCDALMPKDEFELIKNLANYGGGVYLTDSRLHGELDNRSLVDIVMEMVSKAKRIEIEDNKKYRYYMLCSGQDYLIKNISFVESELSKMYPKPYIDCTPYDKNNWIYYKFYRTPRMLAFSKWIAKKYKKGLIRKGLILISVTLNKILEAFHQSSYYKLKKEGLELFGGSAWWILPDVIIDYILSKYIDESTIYSKYLLNNIDTPEEIYFQTMIMNSQYRNLVEVNPKEMVLQNCKTWAYFFDNNKPFKGHPYIFAVDNFDKIKESDCWFARKFDSNVDKGILELIDNNILNIN